MRFDYTDSDMKETQEIIISKIDCFEVDTKAFFDINNDAEKAFFNAVVAKLKEKHEDKCICWRRYLVRKALKKYLDSINCKYYLG